MLRSTRNDLQCLFFYSNPCLLCCRERYAEEALLMLAFLPASAVALETWHTRSAQARDPYPHHGLVGPA
jgi:hypothetical protein